jgi:hypothetical protein
MRRSAEEEIPVSEFIPAIRKKLAGEGAGV